MNVFVGDYIIRDYMRVDLDLYEPNQLCNTINVFKKAMLQARLDAIKEIRFMFESFPFRVYHYEWPGELVWDCELTFDLPKIHYRVPEEMYSSKYDGNGTYVRDGEIIGIYARNGEVMIDVRHYQVSILDVVEIECVLECILSAKNYKDLSDKGFYYKEM